MLEIEVMEITPEEQEMILKKREENAKLAELQVCAVELKNILNRISELGGRVELPGLGGKYVPYHHPSVSAKTISVYSKKYTKIL
jgi:hypothetical protein